MPGLDTENPVKQVFTLFYRSTSAKRSELKFFVRDNFGKEREMTVTFDTESGTAEEYPLLSQSGRTAWYPAVFRFKKFDRIRVN